VHRGYLPGHATRQHSVHSFAAKWHHTLVHPGPAQSVDQSVGEGWSAAASSSLASFCGAQIR
jgi:hypothetical protein